MLVSRWRGAPTTGPWSEGVDLVMYNPAIKDTGKLRWRYPAFKDLSDDELNNQFLWFRQFADKISSLSNDERRHLMTARADALRDHDVGLTYEKKSFWSYLGWWGFLAHAVVITPAAYLCIRLIVWLAGMIRAKKTTSNRPEPATRVSKARGIVASPIRLRGRLVRTPSTAPLLSLAKRWDRVLQSCIVVVQSATRKR